MAKAAHTNQRRRIKPLGSSRKRRDGERQREYTHRWKPAWKTDPARERGLTYDANGQQVPRRPR